MNYVYCINCDIETLNLLTFVPRWPTDGLIERVNERIKKQIERVEEMTGDMDPKTNFALIVIQTELERWKYLVRGFLRARIAKVCCEIFLHNDILR